MLDGTTLDGNFYCYMNFSLLCDTTGATALNYSPTLLHITLLLCRLLVLVVTGVFPRLLAGFGATGTGSGTGSTSINKKKQTAEIKGRKFLNEKCVKRHENLNDCLLQSY